MNQARTSTNRRPSQRPAADTDRPYRGRRPSWAEFWALRPDRRPANDNVPGKRGGGGRKSKRDAIPQTRGPRKKNARAK